MLVETSVPGAHHSKHPGERLHTDGIISLGLALIAVLVYVPTLSFDFVWHDVDLIANNRYMGWLYGLYLGMTRDFWVASADSHHSGFFRPLAYLWFWLQSLGFGASPAGFHGVSVLLHGLNTALVHRLARTSMPRWVSVGAALFFALHPLHVGAVSWVSAQPDLLVAALALSACLLQTRGRRGVYLVLTLALFVKETAFLLPLAFLLQERLTTSKWQLLHLVPYIVYLPLRVLAVEDVPAGVGGSQGLYRLGVYLLRFVAPTPRAGLDFLPAPSLLVLGLVSVGVVCALGFGFVKGSAREKGLLTFMLLAVLPVAELLPLGAPFSDTFFYLPAALLTLLAAGRLARWRVVRDVAPNTRAGGLVAVAVVVSVVAGCVVLFVSQQTWRDERALWDQSAGRDSAFLARTFEHVLGARSAAKQERIFLRILATEPGPSGPLAANIYEALAYCALVTSRDYEALNHLETAIALEPSPRRYTKLTNHLGRMGRRWEGLESARRFSRSHPSSRDAWERRLAFESFYSAPSDFLDVQTHACIELPDRCDQVQTYYTGPRPDALVRQP